MINSQIAESSNSRMDGRLEDARSFALLYREWYSRVYRYAYYRIGPQDAEDATSEIFLGAWRNRASLRGAFAPWLFRIARNVCVDVLRKRERYRQMQSVEAAEATSATQEGPEEETVSRVRHEILRRALSHLPDEQRQVIILKYVAGLSNREVASILEKKENAVNAQQFRALGALRRLLAKEGYEDVV